MRVIASDQKSANKLCYLVCIYVLGTLKFHYYCDKLGPQTNAEIKARFEWQVRLEFRSGDTL